MKPQLRTEEREFQMGTLGQASGVPDLFGDIILQNNLEFHLEEEDEIYEGYGRKTTSYPYRQQNCYERKLSSKKMKLYVLENQYLKAVFLPELGGRLWELTDKNTGKNLLYTNDVIRFSNLAIRNAWFSGGVEWNLGIIGHTPFTCEPLYCVSHTDQSGNPVLRMYEYEQVRKVEYQIDFWLGEEDRFLNCRMRVVNHTSEVTPMYWWSNIAAPEYKGGRIAVPAKQAFTSARGTVYKVDIPMVSGVDVTTYGDIPNQVDYFFDIPSHSPKYIANIDAAGYGLLHMSTARLRSRKLFTWGHNQGSDRWQEFLTEDAGPYVEIQAGLGKTQYGCIPMAPHTAWEWMEQYGPIQIEEQLLSKEYEEFCGEVTSQVVQIQKDLDLNKRLSDTKEMAKTKGKLLSEGSKTGAFENACRRFSGERLLSEHLCYGEMTSAQKRWIQFLETGTLHEPAPEEEPDLFTYEEVIFQRLSETIHSINEKNWYAHYHLGLYYFQKGWLEKAEAEWKWSLKERENPWAYHAMAILELRKGDNKVAKEMIMAGITCLNTNVSYVKEAYKILRKVEAYEDILLLYPKFSSEVQKEGRIYYDYICALAYTGHEEEAFGLLTEGEGYLLADIREGEDSIGRLWHMLYQKVHHVEADIPKYFDFEAMKG